MLAMQVFFLYFTSDILFHFAVKLRLFATSQSKSGVNKMVHCNFNCVYYVLFIMYLFNCIFYVKFNSTLTSHLQIYHQYQLSLLKSN